MRSIFCILNLIPTFLLQGYCSVGILCILIVFFQVQYTYHCCKKYVEKLHRNFTDSYFKVRIKFIYSKKVTKFWEIFTLLLTTVYTVKSKVKILQNYVAFSEYMNFTKPKPKNCNRNFLPEVCKKNFRFWFFSKSVTVDTAHI